MVNDSLIIILDRKIYFSSIFKRFQWFYNSIELSQMNSKTKKINLNLNCQLNFNVLYSEHNDNNTDMTLGNCSARLSA